MSEQIDIITAINELLEDAEYWDQVLAPPPKAEHQPPTPAPAPLPQPRPPKICTVIQRLRQSEKTGDAPDHTAATTEVTARTTVYNRAVNKHLHRRHRS
ncbi:hypothetical protein RF55_11974 [Lasius niger]|uniref:Uncharacterized protein n=1 Tax=Lasius niger TaxID=67767 RepID=A0A0J7KEA7_LASNI|nr:hypothetical protein RF55_11974 [Lasius niger]